MDEPSANILVIEDEAVQAELICHAFSGLHGRFNLRLAHSLKEARALLAEFRPDVVITDLFLPDGSGTELLPGPDVRCSFPVIIMTGSRNEHDAVELIKAGAADYVVKSSALRRDLPRIAERVLREWKQALERRRFAETSNKRN